MQTGRLGKLWNVLQKFVNETLKPMSAANLSSLMTGFPKDFNPESYSDMLIGGITQNCLAEFETIIGERNLAEKVDRLDDLIAQGRGYDVNMAAFEFRPTDPDVVRKAIIADAKRQEIDSLKRLLSGLQSENEDLEKLAAEEEQQMASLREQIQSFKDRSGI
jgi:hypothetical protein